MAATDANARPEPHVDEARTLPARYYTDPELFRRELAAIHHDMWLPASRIKARPWPRAAASRAGPRTGGDEPAASLYHNWPYVQ